MAKAPLIEIVHSDTVLGDTWYLVRSDDREAMMVLRDILRDKGHGVVFCGEVIDDDREGSYIPPGYIQRPGSWRLGFTVKVKR